MFRNDKLIRSFPVAFFRNTFFAAADGRAERNGE